MDEFRTRDEDYRKNVVTIIHEMLHILLIDDSQFQNFEKIDPYG